MCFYGRSMNDFIQYVLRIVRIHQLKCWYGFDRKITGYVVSQWCFLDAMIMPLNLMDV